jgi:hypothetical protein
MGVALRKVAALPALGWWLLVVGAVRLGFAWSGFFDARAVRAGGYSNTHGVLLCSIIYPPPPPQSNASLRVDMANRHRRACMQ